MSYLSESEFETLSGFETEEYDDLITPPFELSRSYGLNASVPIINLRTENESLIAYACSHAIVLYNCHCREMSLLQGHRNCIRILSSDVCGKWLLSADSRSIIIWEIKNRISKYIILNAHGNVDIAAASLSPNGQYIVTIGNENVQLLKVWNFGEKMHSAATELKELKKKQILNVCFSYETPYIFAVTSLYRVLFVKMNLIANKHQLLVDSPFIRKQSTDYGNFNATTFITKATRAFSATNHGFVLVWGYDIDNDSATLPKIQHIKSVPLQKANITTIVNFKSIIATGNSRGEIHFYDGDLKLMYWCHRCSDPIKSISFDLDSKSDVTKDSDLRYETSEQVEKCSENEKEGGVERDTAPVPSNVTMKIEFQSTAKNCSGDSPGKSVPSKHQEKYDGCRPACRESITKVVQQNVFHVNKFVVGTATAKIISMDVASLKYRSISNYFNSELTALDVNPKSPHIVLASKSGTLYLANHECHRLTAERAIGKISKSTPTIREAEVCRENCEGEFVTTLAFSPSGVALLCGTNSGVLWVLNSSTLDPLDSRPYKVSSLAVVDIVFSEDSYYTALYDQSNTIALFQQNRSFRKNSSDYFKFIDKIRSHSAPISSLLFGEQSAASDEGNKSLPRFLSLDADKNLVEYDLGGSGPGLRVLRRDRLNCDGQALCMLWYQGTFLAVFCSNVVCPNSAVYKQLCKTSCIKTTCLSMQYKIYLIDAQEKDVRSTILGPILSSPMTNVVGYKISHKAKHSDYVVFCTEKEIGLQLLPFDGNACRTVGIVGHPDKILRARLSHCKKYIFTIGCNDYSALKWKINYKLADALYHRSSGPGLSPFYSCLIDTARNDFWYLEEMQALFFLLQIFAQGDRSMSVRRIEQRVSALRVDELMSALGLYLSRKKLENLRRELQHSRTLDSLDKPSKAAVRNVTFEEFVRLYVNHKELILKQK